MSRYQKKHSPTHHSDPSSNPYQLLPSTTIHSILPVQIKCLAIFLQNLSPCPLWSTSWSGALHLIFHTFFTQSLSSFCSTCPYHRNLFCCSINIISSIPSLCCHSNESSAPIANLPNSAQLQGTPYHSHSLHPGPCSSVGML